MNAARMREALTHIPASDRDTWLKMGMAIKSDLGDSGFDVWEAWSQGDESFNAKDARDVWKSIHANGKVTAGTLFHAAKANGWRDDGAHPKPIPEDIAERKRIATEQEAKNQSEKTRERVNAAKMAAALWKAGAPASAEHPYLLRKNVKPVATLREIDTGAAEKILGYTPKSRDELLAGQLLIVPVKIGNALSTIELIDEAGRKSALYGGAKACGYWAAQLLPEGDGATLTLLIGEGVATVLSAWQATGYHAIAVLSSGNFPGMARAMRQRYPAAKIVILADLVNVTGEADSHASEAAQIFGAELAIPDFGDDRPKGATDFNDLHQAHGLTAVQRCIAGASAPTRTERVPSAVNAPEPLPELPSVMAFDYSYLPDALRDYVQDVSERMQSPPDFAAVGVLVMIATIVGRKIGIRPMRRNDWTVIVNLWGAVVGNSGVMKSPTLSASLSAIKKLQAAEYDAFNRTKAEFDAQAEVAKLQRSVKKTLARATLKDNQAADVKELLRSGTTDYTPVLKRFITNNASYEALGELLIENPNGLLVESDEIVGLLKQLDANGQEVARSFYLTAADGDKSYTFDRIMRGKGLHIDALCLSIIGGIQPGVLAEYVRQATGGGSGADGLLQRFGLMVYPDVSPNWKEIDRYPDSAARDAINLLAEWLDKLNPAEIGAEDDKYGAVPFLRFNSDAQVLFSEWRAKLEHRLRSGEEHPAIVSHLSKYRKLVPSLALINHLCDTRQGEVSEASLLRAITFSEYLESHAQRIYSYATRPDIEAAKTLLKRLASGKLPTTFKARELSQKGWAGLETPSKARCAIELLLEYRHLIAEEVDTGGRPTTRYHWIKADAV